MACLCAPTSHEGSFRCRLHRSPNPAQSSPNHPIKALNYSTNTSNVTSTQIGTYITVRESSTSGAVSMAPHLFDDHARTAQVAADLQNRIHSACAPSSSSPSDSLASSSSSTAWKSPSYRLSASSSSFSLLTRPLHTSSSSSSSRASALSSSPSPSSPLCCMRPPTAKRPSSLSSSPPKSPCRVSSPPAAPSPWCGASSTTPSASHAAAWAIMKQHSHNKHGARTHNRNTLGPASAFKIGPSRLSRMAVACADELPLLKEEQYNVISDSLRHGGTPGPFTDTPNPSGFGPFRAAQVGLKTRSAANKFKQSESSCRIVGSKEGSLIMPTVY